MSLLHGPARFILKLLGWRLLDLSQRPAKAVVIAYPHTSNWDFPVTLLALAALPFRAHWVGKDTMFRGILGPIMRGLGGIAVNRRERTGFVERVADEFRRRENFHLIIATEGTRSRQAGWKSGFYRIAVAAGVPVIMAVVDYPKREAGLLASIELTGNEDADMARIAACYEGRKGYHPENASPIRLL
ncbi:MAG: phospholipid/glycerol acyltransferase [Rhodocyclaceae bacterium]|nr:MAG: phospholipid/glycerol acyltransferase [Rhodocyclaceae bacterium]TNC99384.1 MAG: phospholipid/glycerol acyltransferase [Rhodocyclaceae bacterium]